MVLQVKNLTLSMRQNASKSDVLRDINFSLSSGQVIGLVGESGAGKSMIGRVLSRNLPELFTVASGQVLFADEDILNLSQSKLVSLLGDKIAFIPQEPLRALNPIMTIGQQFSEHLSRIGHAVSSHQKFMVEALQEVRLSDPKRVLESYPFQLSGGMCQRILIAMAFASNPTLIIADEPTTALDVSTQATIVQIMRRLQKNHGTALLFITHDLRLAAHVCDEILVLYAGEVVECGPAKEVFSRPEHPYTQALQAANPSMSGPLKRLPTLPEQMPGLATFASLEGCRFAPRCSIAQASCQQTVPKLHETSPQHWVRCPIVLENRSEKQFMEDFRTELSSYAIKSDIILQVIGLSKHFEQPRNWYGRHSGPAVQAVHPMDMIVKSGEFIGIVGESGSGKSTLARLLMGLDDPSTGKIVLDGKDVTTNAGDVKQLRLDMMQMVFQDPQSALNPRRSVLDLVTQVMESRAKLFPYSERRLRAHQLLSETGLSADLIDRYPSQLSGGQKQRVNIARALCVTPRLLIADEIVSGLDVSVQAQILNLLLDLKAQRDISLIFISHDLSVVRYLCSKIVVMRHGKIVEQGATQDIFNYPQHDYTKSLFAAAPPSDLNQQWPPNDFDVGNCLRRLEL